MHQRKYLENKADIGSSAWMVYRIALPALVLILLLNSSDSAKCQDKLSTVSVEQNQNEPKRSKTPDVPADNTLAWSKPISEGPDQVFYFAEAVSGKQLKAETQNLLHGVNEVVIEKNRIVFRRVDKEELSFGSDSDHGSKFFKDWEKSKVNLQDKFGKAGKDFLDGIENVHLDGERIVVVRKSQDTRVELGKKTLHRAFDLRALRLTQISLQVDTSGKHPTLKDIDGVTAIINAPGFSFPVNVKEFGKVRLKKGNDIRVGVRNPVPGALRAFLFMPAILRFHFVLPRKE